MAWREDGQRTVTAAGRAQMGRGFIIYPTNQSQPPLWLGTDGRVAHCLSIGLGFARSGLGLGLASAGLDYKTANLFLSQFRFEKIL